MKWVVLAVILEAGGIQRVQLIGRWRRISGIMISSTIGIVVILVMLNGTESILIFDPKVGFIVLIQLLEHFNSTLGGNRVIKSTRRIER